MTFGASDEAINAEEVAIGRALPETLRARLRTENGWDLWIGDEHWTRFPVWDPSDQRSAGRTTSHITRETNSLQRAYGDQFPKDAVAVAEDDSGDPLLRLQGENRPAAWRLSSGKLEPLAVDWSRRSPGKSRRTLKAVTREIESALADVLARGNGIEIAVPGKPAVVQLASESDGIRGTASIQLTRLQAYHVGDQLNRELTAQGWTPSGRHDAGVWTRRWPPSEGARSLAIW